jgi:preprotein translocase subunit SecA
LALDDDLMRIFGAARLEGMLTSLGLKTGEAIMHPWINKALEKAQKRVEARYFESRKELLKYDNVMNEQRVVVYKQRNDLMTATDLHSFVEEITGDVIENICEANIPEKSRSDEWNLEGIHSAMQQTFGLDITDLAAWKTDEGITETKAYETLLRLAKNRYEYQKQRYGDEMMKTAETQMTLSALDNVWRKHLQQMDYLQSGIGLRGYAQKNPLYEYKREAFELFRGTMNNFKSMSLAYLCRMELSKEDIEATEQEHRQRDASLNDATPAYDESGTSGSRNAQCPCGSGKKYKHCCGKLN